MATGLLTQACIAQAIQDMTATEKSAVCASLACTPAALNQSPGTGATVPATAPASGASPFFVQTPSNLLHVWNGTAYVAITAAGGGGGGGAPTSTQIVTAICGSTGAAYAPDAELKIFAGTGAGCQLQAVPSGRIATGSRSTAQTTLTSISYQDAAWTTTTNASFGTWSGNTFTFSRAAKAFVTARGFLVSTRTSTGSAFEMYTIANFVINGVQLMGTGVSSDKNEPAGSTSDGSVQFNLSEVRSFAAGDTIKMEVLTGSNGGTPLTASLGSGAIETNMTIAEFI